MKRYPFSCALALMCTATAYGQPGPTVRAKFVPATSVIVGQPIQLQVEVLVPNFFTGAPEFPPIEIDGAIVTLSEDRPEHFTEQISGITFAGIRRFYIVYTEQPGTFTTPPVEISVPYAAKPPETTVAKLPLPRLRLAAALPPEARHLDYFLPTSRLTLTQRWSRPLTQIRAGDSISRTITVATQKTKAMLIPPVALSAPDGVSVYPQSPSVNDERSAIGEFTQGVRTERATYLFTKAGDYVLPGIEITWWNLSSQRLVTSRLPPAKLHVSDNPAYASELPPEPEPAAPLQPVAPAWRSYLPFFGRSVLVLAIFAGLVWFLWRLWPRLVSGYGSLAANCRDSEAGHWRRLKLALSSNDAARSYASLLAWLRRQGLSLEEFHARASDATLDQQIATLSQTLFKKTGKAPWNGRALLASLSAHRQLATVSDTRSGDLPPLNPAGVAAQPNGRKT